MDALKIRNILQRYKAEPEFDFVQASFALIAEGANAEETRAMLENVNPGKKPFFVLEPVPASKTPQNIEREFDWSWFICLHREDAGQYKIGTLVRYIGETFPEYQGKEYKVLASNIQDEESTEYCLEDFPYLVYGDEIQPVETRPDDCVCSDQAYSVYGCMCGVRRMPG